MIPDFDDFGCLPPGIHPATLDEIDARFGQQSELRRVQMESVKWMIDLAVRGGAAGIILNGSFVTDIIEPNDVDCVLLFLPDTYRDPSALKELRDGLPFLELKLVAQEEFDEFVYITFATDRIGYAKGMIEVML